jgi:TfoX/Sxy family transcriptional regulator of competence genes
VSPELEALRRDLQDAATHLGRPHDLRFKPMFGGWMAYFAEKPCAWISAQGLALKLAAADQPALLAQQGAMRFQHKPGAPPSRHYIVVPRAFCDDTVQLGAWLARSASAPTEKKKPRPKTRPL